jgi:hypothetical protein
MAERVAKFFKNGGNLEVEIEIGQNKTGSWEFFLFDKDNIRLQRRSGTTTIATIPITSHLSQLDGGLFMLDATINGANKPNQRWKVFLRIKQDGQSIEGGNFEFPEPGGEDPMTFKLVLVMKTKEVRLQGK